MQSGQHYVSVNMYLLQQISINLSRDRFVIPWLLFQFIFTASLPSSPLFNHPLFLRSPSVGLTPMERGQLGWKLIWTQSILVCVSSCVCQPSLVPLSNCRQSKREHLFGDYHALTVNLWQPLSTTPQTVLRAKGYLIESKWDWFLCRIQLSNVCTHSLLSNLINCRNGILTPVFAFCIDFFCIEM